MLDPHVGWTLVWGQKQKWLPNPRRLKGPNLCNVAASLLLSCSLAVGHAHHGYLGCIPPDNYYGASMEHQKKHFKARPRERETERECVCVNVMVTKGQIWKRSRRNT